MNETVSPPFPLNPFVGQVWMGWIWNGSIWACFGQGPVMKVTKFTASGAYTPAVGLTFAVVECIGGGGVGGNATGSGNNLNSGGGGGSGGYSRVTLAAAIVAGGGIPVTIGQGGTTGVGGGTTSFGAYCIANGGGPGGNGGPPTYGPCGQRALPGTGDIALPGAAGGAGAYFAGAGGLMVLSTGGQGGQIIGGNAIVNSISGQLTNGGTGDPNSGAGGGGGISNTAPSGTAFGGIGGSGLCVVTEFCFGPNAVIPADDSAPVQECDDQGNPVGAMA